MPRLPGRRPSVSVVVAGIGEPHDVVVGIPRVVVDGLRGMVGEHRRVIFDHPGDERLVGADDAGEDLVVHHAADGEPWLWEIEHASRHPEHITAALAELRRRSARAAEYRRSGVRVPARRPFRIWS